MDDHEYEWLYVPGNEEAYENLEGYRVGGYHPVVIGDKLDDGKYTIVHKLGAGTAATVWLAQTMNHHGSQYVAVKILSANHSTDDCNELQLQKHLQKQVEAGHKLSSVALLLDSFWMDGPNGRHLCLTYPVAGPSLSMIRRNDIKIGPDKAQALALQTAHGLQELHNAGVVYGDLSSNNLLFRLADDINSWTVEELYERFGPPEEDEIQTADGRPLDDHAPICAYLGIRFCQNALEYLKPEIAFVDLAEGRLTEEAPREHASGWSVAYTAPETLWFSEMQDRASDIWALACIWFEMRAATQMFEEGYGSPEEVQEQIIELIGALPASWIEKLPPHESPEPEEAPEYIYEAGIEGPHDSGFDEEEKAQSIRSMKSRLREAWLWIMNLFRKPETMSDPEIPPAADEDDPQSDVPEYFRPQPYAKPDGSLHGKIEHIGKWREWHYLPLEERLRRKKEWSEEEYGHLNLADVDDEPPPRPLSDEEKFDFENLLSSILKFDNRASLEEVVQHTWFKKKYASVGTDGWLKEYTQGWKATRY